MGAVVGVRRRGLEITCCLFRIDRNLEGVKCASETQTLAHDTPVTGTGVWPAIPGGTGTNVWGLWLCVARSGES